MKRGTAFGVNMVIERELAHGCGCETMISVENGGVMVTQPHPLPLSEWADVVKAVEETVAVFRERGGTVDAGNSKPHLTVVSNETD